MGGRPKCTLATLTWCWRCPLTMRWRRVGARFEAQMGRVVPTWIRVEEGGGGEKFSLSLAGEYSQEFSSVCVDICAKSHRAFPRSVRDLVSTLVTQLVRHTWGNRESWKLDRIPRARKDEQRCFSTCPKKWRVIGVIFSVCSYYRSVTGTKYVVGSICFARQFNDVAIRSALYVVYSFQAGTSVNVLVHGLNSSSRIFQCIP